MVRAGRRVEDAMWWLPMQATPSPVPGGGDVNPTIDKGGLPGGDALTHLVGGLMYLGLIACVGAIVAGAAMWGLSAHNGNYRGAYNGRLMVIGGAVGAFLIGAAAALVRFAFGAGQGV
jgi:hypothetical protein